MHVLLVEAEGLEQLRDGVDALGLRLVFLLQLGFGLGAFARVGFGRDVNFVQRRGEVGQHEGVRVLGAEEIAAFFGQVGFVALFVNGEEQLLLFRVKLDLLLVSVQLQLGLVHHPQVFGVFEHLHQPFGFGLAKLDAVKQQPDFLGDRFSILDIGAVFRVRLTNQLLGFRQEPIAQTLLGLED